MTLHDILDMVALQLGQTEVKPDDHLYGDLGAESIDLVHLAIALEDRYQIILPEEDLADIQTVRDLFFLAQRHGDAAT